MAYELKIPQYAGPLEKLLELIENRKLEITEISLAQVTDDFLRYLETLRIGKGDGERLLSEDDLRERIRTLADFVVVASRLIFIKSRSLLPSLAFGEEEEADIRDLEIRLKLYRELKPLVRALASLWRNRAPLFGRPYFLETASSERRVFFPGTRWSAEDLRSALAEVFVAFEKFTMEEQTIKEKIVSLEEKVNEVMARLREFAETRFSDLSRAAGSRAETIITFLALLHLAREQLIFLEQEEHLSDIIVRTHRDNG